MSENGFLNNNKVCFNKRVAVLSLILILLFSFGIILNKLSNSLSNRKLAIKSRASEVSTPIRSGETEEKAKKQGESKVEMGVSLGSEIGPRAREGKGGYYGDVVFAVYPYGLANFVSENDYYDNSKSIRLNIRCTTTYGESCEQSGTEYYSGKGYDWYSVKKYELTKGTPLNIPIFNNAPFKGNVFAHLRIVDDRVDVTAVPADGVTQISYDAGSYIDNENLLIKNIIKKFHGLGENKRYFSIDPFTDRMGVLLGSGKKSAIVLSVDTIWLNNMRIPYESVNGSAISPDAIFACVDLPRLPESKK